MSFRVITTSVITDESIPYSLTVDTIGSGAITLRAVDLLSSVVDNDPAGNVTWTIDTAVNIIAGLLGKNGSVNVGDSFRCHLHNNATAASGEIVTIAAGVGVTLHGSTLTLTEGTNVDGDLLFVVRNVTSGSEAVDAYMFTGGGGGGGVTLWPAIQSNYVTTSIAIGNAPIIVVGTTQVPINIASVSVIYSWVLYPIPRTWQAFKAPSGMPLILGTPMTAAGNALTIDNLTTAAITGGNPIVAGEYFGIILDGGLVNSGGNISVVFNLVP